MKLNRSGFLCMVILTIVAGCTRQGKAPLKRDGSPAEIVAQFTNLLATGNIPDRIGALSALGTLARESWDFESKQTALVALLQATASSDTNVQKEARSQLMYPADPELSPSWSSAAVVNASTSQLNNDNALVRCAAASLLLRQDDENSAAASALFSLLKHPDGAVRLQDRTALALDPLGYLGLKEQLQIELRSVWNLPDPDIRLDALSQYWELKQSKFSGGRVEAELTLLELLQSTNAQVRRKAVNILVGEHTRISELATLPLQDFIQNGLANPDPYLTTTMAHVINETDSAAAHRLVPVAGTLEALNAGLSHPDPAVRLAALSPMAYSHRIWWRISSGTNNSPFARTAANPLILQSLTNALQDADLEVRLCAVDVLRYLSDWSEPSFPSLWKVKIAAVQSRDPVERRRSFRRATSLPNAPQSFVDLFKAALKDPDWQVRLSAMQPVWMSGLNGFYADHRLWSPLCDDPVPAVRVDAGNLLGREAAAQGRGTNAPWSKLPSEMLHLVDDPFPNISLVGLVALRQLAAATNETPVVLDARHRLDQIAASANTGLKVRLARCYARTFNWAKSPDTEKHLQILATSPEAIVRRHAVAALRFLKLSLPSKIEEDSDPEVRLVATNAIQQKLSEILSPPSLDVLVQRIKEGDPAVRRKAAVVLAQNQEAKQRSGVAAEALRVLLETYTNAPPTELQSINYALRNLNGGPNYASLQSQVHAFAVEKVLNDEPGVRRGVWALLADTTYRNGWFQPEQVLAVTVAGLRRIEDPNVSVRVSVIRVLSTLEPQLIRQAGEANAVTARQIRTILVEALKDPEPEVAIAAAASFLKTPGDGTGILDRIGMNAELSSRAALILEQRLAEPQPDVRQIMSSALALIGANRLETNWVEKAFTSWEGLFTRPGRLREFFFSSSTDISGLNVPSGDETLRSIAYGSANSTVRQRAMQTLVRLLDALAIYPRSDLPTPLSSILGIPISRGRFTIDELDPVRQALVRMTGNTNTALADEAARCLSGIPAHAESLSGDLVRRAHSANAKDRRLAMLELGKPNQISSELFRKEARSLAEELTRDSDDSVREAALEAFAFNTFPNYGAQGLEILSVDPLVKALDDSVPEIQLKAFRTLSGNFQWVRTTDRQRLALPFIHRVMAPDFSDVDYQFTGCVADLAGFVQDQTTQQRLLLDAQAKINSADNDKARSRWLAVMGRLYLGFNEPDKAVEAFRKCIRLAPDLKDDSVLRDLERSLLSAGRYNEAAFEPAPRPNGFEYLSRLEAFAKEQNFSHLVLYANRALDGYLPAYGWRTQIRGWGEPDFLIREIARLLHSLGKLDVLEEFLKGALKRYPESPEIPVAQAMLCLKQGRKDEAKLVLERELKRHFWNDAALNTLGTLYRENGQSERYEVLLLGLIEKHPEQLSLCRPMVEICLRTGQTNEARKFIARFDSEAGAVFRNSVEDFAANPDFSSRYSAHQRAMSQLLELCNDLDGAIKAQIEANKAISYQPHLLSGQQRLNELKKRAGKALVEP